MADKIMNDKSIAEKDEISKRGCEKHERRGYLWVLWSAKA